MLIFPVFLAFAYFPTYASLSSLSPTSSLYPTLYQPSPPLCWTPWEYQALLLPPSHCFLLSWPPLYIQESAYNGLSSYVLQHCIIPPVDVCLDLLDPIFPHRVPQRGVLPSPIRLLPWKIYQKPPYHPMVEKPQQTLYMGHHSPRLRSKDKNGLDNGN